MICHIPAAEAVPAVEAEAVEAAAGQARDAGRKRKAAEVEAAV